MRYWSKHYKLFSSKAKSAKDIDNDPNMVFCCTDLAAALCDERISIKYEPRLREYWLVAKEKDMTITFCPWCGHKLPKELRNEFFEEIELVLDKNEVNIWDTKAKIPPEFKTDEWWKKRGL